MIKVHKSFNCCGFIDISVHAMAEQFSYNTDDRFIMQKTQYTFTISEGENFT